LRQVSQEILRKRVPALSRLNTSRKFLFTKDPTLLNKYYEIRANCYRAVEDGPSDFSYEADELDRLSDILVVIQNGYVIGGARLVASTPENPIKLPVEQDNFRMKNVFPEYNLQDKTICEFGRIAIAKEFRSFSILEGLCEHLIKKAIDKGYHYQFSMAPKAQTRCYRRVGHKLNLPYPYIVHENIDVPLKPLEETGKLKMYLGSLRLPNTIEEQTHSRHAA